jgi:transitional endoplasmic reticulum ATPase
MGSKKQHQSVFKEISTYKQTASLGFDHRSKYLDIIKRSYPHHYVTCVNPEENAEFMEYAEAGLAKATLIHHDDHLEHSRIYNAPNGGRLYKQAGSVGDKVFCGKYSYEWQGKEYILWRTVHNNFYGGDVKWDFVLYPRGASDEAAKDFENCPEIDALLKELGIWSTVPHEDIYVFDQGYIHRSRSVWMSIKDATWEDVVMDPGVKNQLMKDILSFFTNETKEIYMRYSIPYKRGILLHGPPGNGKTSTIRALIAHLMRLKEPVPTLYVKSTIDKCKGDHVSIKKIFNHARKMAPCVVVLEDLDSLVNESKVRSYFLNEMDGLEANDGILIIGSTNHLDDIDEAIRSRPSRFDRKYAFDIPQRSERELYARYWFEKLKNNDEIDFKEEMCPIVADLTADFSYAFMKELFVSALVMIARQAIGDEIDWDVVNPASAKASSKGDDTPNIEEVSDEVVEEKKDTNDKKEVVKKEEKKKREIPHVDVPETLKENTFFKLIYMNVGVLLQNMDDNDEAERKSKNKKDKKKEDKKEDDDEDGEECTDGSCG